MIDKMKLIHHAGDQLVTILDEEITDLHKYLTNLEPEDFAKASSAKGWTNADVISHIAMGAMSYHMYLSRALEGILDPPPGLPQPSRGYLAKDVSKTILESTKQIEYGNSSTLVERFHANCKKLQKLLLTLKKEDWTQPVYHRLGNTTIRGLLLYRISEVCLHEWDVKSSLESAPILHPRTIHPLLERIPGWLDWVFKPGNIGHNYPIYYRYYVTNPIQTFWEIIIHDNSYKILYEPSSNTPDVEFESDSLTAILFLTGRLKAKDLITTTRLISRGSKKNLEAFLNSYTSI